MHIVILAEFAVASGGAEKVAVESAHGLARAGIDVTFIHAIEGPADPLLDHPNIRRVCLGNTDIWNRPTLEAAWSGVWSRESAARLRTVLGTLAQPADIVHLHQWTRSLSPSVFPVLLDSGIPLVVTLHDYFLACPNGVYYRFDQDRSCGLTPLSASCVVAPCDPKSRLHKVIRVGRSIAQNRALRGRHLNVVHVCDSSIFRMGDLLGSLSVTHHRIDNPVRVEKGPRADPATGKAIAYVGRLTREKGADLVAEAARDAGMPALFIGTGPLDAELRAQPHVDMLGWRSPGEVSAILVQRARALAAPSRWFETGPLTVYEALAVGLPVVASDRSGAAEKVIDGVTGYVVPPDRAALATAFRSLDAIKAETLGRAAHTRYWEAPMSIDAHADALVRLYLQIA
ncbi:glycosyltransferase [Methylobacterium sp. E-045]|uniref:glycosyltransferase n=1 Tax=Methylobacterium sp. E-045 TaxID=2836575 RepID=UPI001FB88125|nr:glycosyltransferase [Methylobacterium sp. E-045]MCJ2131850.1 glycosyltransferase [Methylobacterium sp. E-045]